MFDNYRDVDERDVTDTTLVDVEGLHFSRGENEIFRGVDLRIPKGKITAVMGPSGTGKTTLLKLIGGQLVPDGRVSMGRRTVCRGGRCRRGGWACCSRAARCFPT